MRYALLFMILLPCVSFSQEEDTGFYIFGGNEAKTESFVCGEESWLLVHMDQGTKVRVDHDGLTVNLANVEGHITAALMCGGDLSRLHFLRAQLPFVITAGSTVKFDCPAGARVVYSEQ